MNRVLVYTQKIQNDWLKYLPKRDLGNTVIVVEHDEDIMKAADMIIIIQRLVHSWGNLVAQGTYDQITWNQLLRLNISTEI
jgi:excinuclease UvrABC ATPase subunit